MTLGGRPARHVAFAVRDDVGCDPGFFFVYRNAFGGPFWPETKPGDTIRAWIIEVGGRLLYIEGATQPDARPDLVRDVQQIVESIRFE